MEFGYGLFHNKVMNKYKPLWSIYIFGYFPSPKSELWTGNVTQSQKLGSLHTIMGKHRLNNSTLTNGYDDKQIQKPQALINIAGWLKCCITDLLICYHLCLPQGEKIEWFHRFYRFHKERSLRARGNMQKLSMLRVKEL